MPKPTKVDKLLQRYAKHFTPGRAKWLVVDVAHWESIVGQSKTNRCLCCDKKNGPRCSFKNKRQKQGGYARSFLSYVCCECVIKIEEKLGVKLEYSHAP